MEAPARWMLVRISGTTRCSSSQPLATAALPMGFSPLTLYAPHAAGACSRAALMRRGRGRGGGRGMVGGGGGGGVIGGVGVVDDAGVSVVGVLAKADVGDDEKLEVGFADGFDGALDYSLGRERTCAARVF